MANTKRGYKKRSAAEVLSRNESGEKECHGCNQWLPEMEFAPNDGRTSDSLHGKCRACVRFRRYRLTRTDVELLLEQQRHACPVCGRPFHSFGDFVVDHDQGCCPGYGGIQTCGQCVRGLVCQPCNVNVLPLLENTPLMERGFTYLGKN